MTNTNQTVAPIPSGTYRTQLTKVEHKVFSTGNDSVRVQCVVTAGEHAGEQENIDVYLDDEFLDGKNWLFIKNVKTLLDMTIAISSVAMMNEMVPNAGYVRGGEKSIVEYLNDMIVPLSSPPQIELSIARGKTSNGKEYTDYTFRGLN